MLLNYYKKCDKTHIWCESKGESKAIRVNFALESNVIRHLNGTIRHKKGATKGIMC